MADKVKVIAYYLPQFHPIPENDEWWGKGFTEWTNVGKAKPLYRGHYQPKVPADLGYYDLRMSEVRVAQAKMAQEAGIEGFMYWHYWFGNGKQILERPFREVVSSGAPDFPFCLGWANHSWSNKTWISNKQRDNRLLIEQTYSGESDYTKHFYTLLGAFADKRYLKVDDKPIFLIYRPLDIPNVEKFVELWNQLAIMNGLKGIYFVGLSEQQEKHSIILSKGFDAINSNGMWGAETSLKGRYLRVIHHKINQLAGGALLDIYDFSKISKLLFNDSDKSENVYPTIIPQWDRSARAGKSAVIYVNSTPDQFRAQVLNALEIVKHKQSKNKILFLKSWNEWAEGNYIEPDLKYGHGYLNVLKELLK